MCWSSLKRTDPVRILFVESGVLAPGKFVYQCYPPHGLMYLAAYVREHRPHHELRIYDMMAGRAGPDAITPVLESYEPQLVAVHAMTFQANCMHALAAKVKRWNPRCTVAVGGPHPSGAPASVLADGNIDVAGIGEGEQTFLDIVDKLEKSEGLESIPGAAVMRQGELIQGPPRDLVRDISSLPFPAWDLVDLSKYFTDAMLNQNDITCRREVTTMFTSRACPFRCIFCHNMFGKGFRPRTVENVLDEMETLQREHGVRELHLIDDCFNFDPQRAKAILLGIRERGLDFALAFPNGMRGDRLPEGLLDAMVEAGVYKINVGVESGSKRVQKLIRKGLSLEAVRDGIRRAAARGIFCHGFFMLGFPDETVEEMSETIEFACGSDLHTAGFALLTPFPGTELARVAAEAGRLPEFDFDETSFMSLSVNLTAVDDATLMKMHRRAHRRFYASPSRLYRIVKTMPHPSDLVRVGSKHLRLKFL